MFANHSIESWADSIECNNNKTPRTVPRRPRKRITTEEKHKKFNGAERIRDSIDYMESVDQQDEENFERNKEDEYEDQEENEQDNEDEYVNQ
ncbi:hypothetical protein V3C99_004623 [Haemonchus contortus]